MVYWLFIGLSTLLAVAYTVHADKEYIVALLNTTRPPYNDARGWLRHNYLEGRLPPLLRVVRAEPGCANDSTILKHILQGYNRHKVPGGGVEVSVEVWVQEITTISDITSDFTLDIYISEQWLDEALAYERLNPCKRNISLNSDVLEKLWTPNSCFINSKTASIHESPFKNIFLMIYPNGSIWTNYRLKLTGPCNMELQGFPFDHVSCELTFESFNYNIDEVKMNWSPIGVDKMRDKMELADYELVQIDKKRTQVVRLLFAVIS